MEFKIEVPKGYEIDKKNSTFEKIVFKEVKKEITERIKTVDDAIAELGEQDEQVILYNQVKKAGVTGHILAFQELVVVVKALNENWIPDYENSSEYKYYPYFYLNNNNFRYDNFSCGYEYGSGFSSRLVLKTSNLAEYAGTQFLETYKMYIKKDNKTHKLNGE